jgi:two-component system sensor histidine kinase KdpD
VTAGTLRIYLGAAPGVGKTFAMLNEGQRRADRGADVVVGIVETHGRPNTAAQLEGLELVPRRTVLHRGQELSELDVDAVVARHPAVALIDELAHTNAPGSPRAKRWEDIDLLLQAGIDVISTVNIQHLESLNDVVEAITGIRQHETVPDAWVRGADQIELVDMAPEALRRRLAHGNVYPADRVDTALANYFRLGNLTALRELALLWVADRVEENLQQYLGTHSDTAWITRERVVVALGGGPGSDTLIRRAARMAEVGRGELLGVVVHPDDGLAAARSTRLDEQRQLLADVGGQLHEIGGTDIAGALIGFARSRQATQLVLGASRRSRLTSALRGSVINDVIRRSGPIDVHVITTDDTDHELPAPLARRHRHGGLPPRRQMLGVGVGALLLPAVTAGLIPLRRDWNVGTVMLVELAAVVAVAAIGGILPAAAAAVAAFLLVNWYFTPPIRTLSISEPEDIAALLVFLAVAGAVSGLVDLSARRAADAARARSEAAALATAAGAAVEHDPLPQLLKIVVESFGVDGAAVLRRHGRDWVTEAAEGAAPRTPAEASRSIAATDDIVLGLAGHGPGGDDERVLKAFAAQVGQAVARRDREADLAAARTRAAGNELRDALLAAVSHDLRTPLAGIKASSSSLLETGLALTADDRLELLRTIDQEADRLNGLVGNLLDMSRLQTGALHLARTAVGLEDVLPRALSSLPPGSPHPRLDLPDDLPPILADAAMLERVVANVIGNAVAHGGGDVVVAAGRVDDHLHVRVIDRGRGIPPRDRADAVQPFQRLGDRPSGSGIGLGLAVAHGFTQAMGGELTLDDTPGGGLTVTIRLPVAPTRPEIGTDR